MMDQVEENRALREMTRQFVHSPLQHNRLHEADAELVAMPGDGQKLLAVTIDTVTEEIAAGLYADPYLAGWMGVMASLSDLAAVGAQPLGVLVSETLPDHLGSEALARLQHGISDACRRCGTHVLGGDTNRGNALAIGCCAIGYLDARAKLTRVGIRPGDLLYATGRLGTGNGFALSVLRGGRPSRSPFLPVARLREGRCLAGLARACMDTSDGVLATLDQLMRINGTGFRIAPGWEETLEPAARDTAREAGLPDWFLLAGQHGEFELLFAIRPEDESLLNSRAAEIGWMPLRLGQATADCQIVLPVGNRDRALPTGEIRDLNQGQGAHLEGIMEGLRGIHDRIVKDSWRAGDMREGANADVPVATESGWEGGVS